MNRNKFYFGIIILVLMAIIVWASYGMLNVGKSEEEYNVTVIVDDSNNERWTAFRQGLEQAAGDYNMDLNYVSTGKLSSMDEELALMQRELENGADGIIVQAISGEEDMWKLEEVSAQVPVFLVESDVIPEEVYAIVGPDNLAMGGAIANAVKDDFGEALSGKKIGILCGNQKQLAMQQRLQGVQEGLAGSKADIVWTIESKGDGESEATDLLADLDSVDIVITLGNAQTEQMVDYLQNMNNNVECHIYGVGCSEKVVYYLDKGIISTLVVPNEFNMGYLSMEAIAKQLYYHLSNAENSQVDYLVINKENLYEEENQKVLFPIVQ